MSTVLSFFQNSRNLLILIAVLGWGVAVVAIFGAHDPQDYPRSDLSALNVEPLTVADIQEDEFEQIVASYAYPKPLYDYPQPPLKDEVFVVEPEKTAKVAPAYEPLIASGSPKIAIIIDDMGVDRTRSFKVLDIDAPLTLAFLPYAAQLEGITRDAKDKGHELMIHMPMQPVSSKVSLGPIAIRDGMDEAAVKQNMAAAFESFDGYVGVNNHMGSQTTKNAQIMDWVMEAIADKNGDLYFIDSKTIGSSVAAETARLNGLPHATRDVFLDHENTNSFVTGALRKAERVAMEQGHAILIGHPKDVTINGLQSWLPDVQSRGFEIVHASQLVEIPKGAQRIASAPPKVKAAKVKAPEPVAVAASIEPAAGDVVEEEEILFFDSAVDPAVDPSIDPNSAQAREAILKRLLGQN